VESGLNTCNRMFKRSRLFTIVLAFASVPGSVHAQATPKPDTKPDYSKEAFVVENTSAKIVFENDGTSTREASARIRIQSDAGVHATAYCLSPIRTRPRVSTLTMFAL
jgi:hypothetical protein